MASSKIQWRNSTRKDLRGIPASDVARIIAAIQQLTSEPMPHGSQKLAGSEHTYRIRIGDYRVIYELIDPDIIQIERIRHRKDVYR